MESILKVSDLNKSYGNFSLSNVSFSLPEGCITGFIGVNGAGKTTTLRTILELTNRTSGHIEFFGLDMQSHEQEIKNRIGVVLDDGYFYEELSLAEMKSIISPAYTSWCEQDFKNYLERFNLNPKQKINMLSKGMKMKYALALALSHKAELLIMDEPTSGLDPLMQNRFIDLILEEKKKGTTIFMSSHLFEEVERTCERTAIIRRGQIAAVEDMEGLKKKRSRDYIITLDSKKSADALQLPGYTITGREGASVTVAVKEDIPGLLSLLSSCPVRDMQIHTQSLEEIFMHYYGSEV